MRYMIVVKASKDSEAGVMPGEELLSAMAGYHEQLAQAGVLVDASGLQPSSKGWRIKWSDGRKTVVDGPFTETKELIAGYTIINVKSEEEAREWASRFPNPHVGDGEIEIRRIFELEDFGDRPEIDRFRELDAGRK
ncbi:hypothetical protein M2281_003092 [Mesorhizobium soli]|uniref:YciI family protein n=1 Tax=Pseudaminobacter soli (ex Li et al. 2025) TaxID=1295366 RepID=UPI00247531FE|nr:YciI family protein [Mesorhizobium soli]MDH6232493.1 hypothetical protein [Mesorhizobium soli]